MPLLNLLLPSSGLEKKKIAIRSFVRKRNNMASATGELAIEYRTRGISKIVFDNGSIFPPPDSSSSTSSATDLDDQHESGVDNAQPHPHKRHSGISRATQPPDDMTPSEQRWCSAAFLMIGIGVAMCWTMLQCGIAYFESTYSLGSKFYLAMVAAYNIPVLPLLLLQAAFDRNYDVKFGADRSFAFRFILAFSCLCATLCVVPFVGEAACLACVVMVGVMDSVAFGTAAQLFSMFPARCGSFYFIGASVTSLLSIAITVGSGFARDSPPSHTSVIITYFLSALVTALGLTATLLLIRSDVGLRLLKKKTAMDSQRAIDSLPIERQRLVREDTDRIDGDKQKKGYATITGEAEPTMVNDHHQHDGEDPAGGVTSATSNIDLFRKCKYVHFSLGLVWLTTTFVGSLVSYVPSQHHSSSLKLILVYVGMISSLAGKQLNALRGKWIKKQEHLFGCVVAVAVSTLFYVFYIAQRDIHKDIDGKEEYYLTMDWVIIPFVAVFNVAAAYFSSLSYGMAAGLIESQTDKAQNSALLGLTLMAGVYVGLGASFSASALISPPTNN